MASNIWKVGDFVYLKSGSPKMTVTAVFSDVIRVAWFVGNKDNKAQFHPDALTDVEPVKG